MIKFNSKCCLKCFYSVERINKAKQKTGLTSFLMLNVLEAKIFQYDFLEGRMCDKITVSCIGDHIGRNFGPWGGF